MTVCRPRPRAALVTVVFLAVLTAAAPAAPGTARADAMYRAAKWAEARAAYAIVLPGLTGDEAARVQNAIAYTLQIQGQYAAAVDAYARTLAMDGIAAAHRANALLKTGICLQLQRQFAEAVATYQRVRDLPGAPPDTVAEALIFTANTLPRLGRTDDAIEALRQLAEMPGVSAHYVMDAHLKIAKLLGREHRYADALRRLQLVAESPQATVRQKSHARSAITECEMLLGGGAPFYLKPYVTRVGATDAEILWASYGAFPPGEVVLAAPGQSVALVPTRTPIKGTACFQHVAAATNLSPHTRYTATVTCSNTTHELEFSTAPPPGAPVTFAVIGDTQPTGERHALVARTLGQDHPEFVVHVGDMTDLGSEWGRWKPEYFDPGWPYLRQGAIWPAAGNHDGGLYFPLLFRQDYQRLYYSFDYGDVHVAVLDSYWSGHSDEGRRRQLAWLDQDLAATKARWKIVAFHVPMITVDYTWESFGTEDFLPLLVKHGVDLVFSGHEHLYHRYRPITVGDRKPFIAITTGGAGGPIGGSLPSPIGVRRLDDNHYCLLRVDGGRLQLQTKRIDGGVFDSLTLVKTDGEFQPEITAQAVDYALAARIKHLYIELLTPRLFELLVDVGQQPAPGRALPLTIDMGRLPRGGFNRERLPEGAQLVVGVVSNCAWQVRQQALDLSGDRLTFEAVPPDPVTQTGSWFQPPLRVEINVRVNGRLFEPATCEVRPRAEHSAPEP